MRRDSFGDVRFPFSEIKRPTGRFMAQAKLPTDGDEHPYGKWSVIVEPFPGQYQGDDGIMSAFVTFVSEEAPRDILRRGQELELYYGPNHIGAVLITASMSDIDTEGLPGDRKRDFLADREAA